MSSDQKLISLVIPTYKGAKTLNDLIEELILTFKNHNIEIVVVNLTLLLRKLRAQIVQIEQECM